VFILSVVLQQRTDSEQHIDLFKFFLCMSNGNILFFVFNYFLRSEKKSHKSPMGFFFGTEEVVFIWRDERYLSQKIIIDMKFGHGTLLLNHKYMLISIRVEKWLGWYIEIANRRLSNQPTNLWAAFSLQDPKSTKRHWQLDLTW